jgi:hypothetical protein
MCSNVFCNANYQIKYEENLLVMTDFQLLRN